MTLKSPMFFLKKCVSLWWLFFYFMRFLPLEGIYLITVKLLSIASTRPEWGQCYWYSDQVSSDPVMAWSVNTLRQRQNGRHFQDGIFKCIFLNENVWISLEISLKFVPRCPIDNKPALVQIMAWRPSDDKPLSEPMTIRLLTLICVTRPQWVI